MTALQKNLSGEKVQWAIGGDVMIDLGPGMRREHDGTIASTGATLHFFRKATTGSTHERLDLGTVEDVKFATLGFKDRDLDAIVLSRTPPALPWAIVADAPQLSFALSKLTASTTPEEGDMDVPKDHEVSSEALHVDRAAKRGGACPAATGIQCGFSRREREVVRDLVEL